MLRWWFVAFAVTLGVAAAIPSLGGDTKRVAFTAAAWKGHVDICAPTRRSRMVGDLVANRLRRGMTAAQLRGLLGEPDRMGARFWSYNAGETHSMLSGCRYLELRLAGGRLVRADVYVSD